MAILPDALLRHAAERPDVPWLFWAEGWDWRWLSWGEAARRVTAEGETLAGAPPLIPYPYHPTPAALLTDLAIQTAGRVPMPLPEGEGVPPPLGGWEGGSGGGQEGGSSRAAEVMVRGSDGVWVEWSREDLAAAADAVAREVAPAGPPAGGREILAACRPLAEPAERAVLAWAILQGAALLLEPDPASFVTTAAWARPTFFHGTVSEIAGIAGIARQAESAPGPLARLLRRPPGLPFGRLRVVLSIEDAEADPATWAGRGVRVGRIAGLPRCGTKGRGRGI